MCGMSVFSWRLFDRRWHGGSNPQALTHFRLTLVGQRKHLHFRAAAVALICTVAPEPEFGGIAGAFGTLHSAGLQCSFPFLGCWCLAIFGSARLVWFCELHP